MKSTGFVKKFIACTLILTICHFKSFSDCLPEVSATFNIDNLSVTANSTKDLSNVVLKFNDGSVQKFDDLSGNSQTFEGTGDYTNLCIVGIWIKSGCNQSGDGPGYGEFVENQGWTGICVSDLQENIKPVLECVDHNSDGTYTAHFGYLNENDVTAAIVVGQNNKFTPSPIDRGQTIEFATGRNYDAFQVDFNGSNLVWTLKSPNGTTRTSTASSNPAQKCQNDDDLCLPSSITGGSIAFNGPYNPQGDNVVENVELPTSTFDGVDFEYVWLQSLADVPNTVGNSSWTMVEGSQNLTDLPVSGLLQTTYFIRCARIQGCDDYWGETNSVAVEVDPCTPASITGGSIAFNGPYNPQGGNVVENVELPTSTFDGVEFEYVWLQSLVDVPNTVGNSSWTMVDGSQNLTDLPVSGLLQTTYFIRCARIQGCDDYWGETNSVAVEVDPCTPASITGGSIAFNGPYNPQGDNVVENVELPTSTYDGVDFEYVWLQSLVDVPNTVGNSSWTMVEGSQNLTDLPVSGLLQTTYFIRCARIQGCDDYWGETNSVAVEVDPCTPASITGGSIAFNGPYNPQGDNVVENVELPTSTFDGVDFEYVWLQSLVDVPNTVGNSSWTMVDGSQNLTDLPVSGLLQTTYFIRCARIQGCDDYWGETNSVAVEVNPCTPASITGGSIAFNGPYNPQGDNVVENVELPTSTFDGVDFEYVWLQSLVDVPNTVGNSSWTMVDGSQNLTDLPVSGLLQTTYFIRCARIQGCDDYWGETNSVAVEVDPCTPASITGGSIAFNGPYNPQGDNVVVNVELPTSTFDGVDFEYVWLQSLVDVPNTVGNSSWTMVDGSQNLTDLPVSGLLQTTYFIRCARIQGCDDYWGETNSVEVQVFEIPTAVLSGGGEFCIGTDGSIQINFSGNGPFNLIYSNGVDNFEVVSDENQIIINVPSGNYSLVSLSDVNYDGTVSGETTVSEYELPTATMSGGGSICGEGMADVTIDLTGTAPFTLTYSNGVDNTEVITEEYLYTFDASVGNYSLVNVQDANCHGTVSGDAMVSQNQIPTASISGGGSICGEGIATVSIELTGTAPFTLTYSNGVDNTEVITEENLYTFDASVGNYSLINVQDANCQGTVSGDAMVIQNQTPTASISGGGSICGEGTATVSIDLTGTAPFTLTYSNGVDNTEVITEENLYTFDASVGNYSLINVQDANCQGTVSGDAIVSQNQIPTASISGGGSICGEGTAIVSIDLTGTAPFTLTYSNGVDNTEVITEENLYTFDASVGNYSLVNVQDANCQGTVSGDAIVSQNQIPTAIISGGGSVCGEGTATVSIELTGTAPFTLTYSNGVDNTEVITEENLFTFDASVGNYSLVNVQDANCQGSVEGEAKVENYEVPTANMLGGGSICENGSVDIIINFTGVGPWTYEYLKNQQVINGVSETASLIINESEIGSYELLTISDSNCDGTVTGSAEITINDTPNGDIYLNDRYCLGDEIILNNDISEDGNTFIWTTTGSGNLLEANSKIAKYVAIEEEENILFTLTVTNSCAVVQFSAETTISGTLAKFSINPEIQGGGLLVGVDYEFIADDQDAASYSWDFDNGNGSSLSTTTQSFDTEGNYTVTLTTEKGKCTDTYSLNISVIENDKLYIPNVISPSSSNPENNTIKVYGEDLSSGGFEFSIYNRWGIVVYQTNDLSQAQTIGWNGESNGEEKGNNVFTYTVRGKYNNGKPFEETGAITLVK